MTSAGVPLLRALNTLQAQAENQAMKDVINIIVRDVQSGAQLADALDKHPDVFSDVYVNMVRAGEAAGIVDEILKRLASQVEKSASMRKKIKSAMTYPVAILSLTFVAFFGLMIFVMPGIGDILHSLNLDAELPALTQAMLNISHFMVNYWWIIIAGMVGGGYMLRKYLKTKAGRYAFHSLILRLPVVGLLTVRSLLQASLVLFLRLLVRA